MTAVDGVAGMIVNQHDRLAGSQEAAAELAAEFAYFHTPMASIEESNDSALGIDSHESFMPRDGRTLF